MSPQSIQSRKLIKMQSLLKLLCRSQLAGAGKVEEGASAGKPQVGDAVPRYEDPEIRLRIARPVTHCWRHAAFLGADQLLRDAATLNGIPGVLIHGRYDVSSRWIPRGNCRSDRAPVSFTSSTMPATAVDTRSSPLLWAP
jgi:hypothetical protein